jgi:uncharacterized protein YqjF (DUF2071 family)
MRVRPEGEPVMEQTWEDLLFLHWPIEEALLRPLIPPELEIDTFEEKVWIGITPFKLTGLRLMSLPPIPGFSEFNEINVRTYVHHHGKPGIWFFSLDASKVIPAIGARVFFGLPYFNARIDFARTTNEFRFDMRRNLVSEAHFQANWSQGMRLRAPDTDSLAFFLVERYALYTGAAGGLNMTRVYHHPWILDEVTEVSFESTLLSALGLPEPKSEPLAHFSSSPLTVQVWPPQVLK